MSALCAWAADASAEFQVSAGQPFAVRWALVSCSTCCTKLDEVWTDGALVVAFVVVVVGLGVVVAGLGVVAGFGAVVFTAGFGAVVRTTGFGAVVGLGAGGTVVVVLLGDAVVLGDAVLLGEVVDVVGDSEVDGAAEGVNAGAVGEVAGVAVVVAATSEKVWAVSAEPSVPTIAADTRTGVMCELSQV